MQLWDALARGVPGLVCFSGPVRFSGSTNLFNSKGAGQTE